MDAQEINRRYRAARKTFAIKTYLLLFVGLILALVQWCIVTLVKSGKTMFIKHSYVCFLTFFLSVLLFAIFIFFDKLRHIKILNYIISIFIVELQIVSVFPLIAKSNWVDLLTFFSMCFLILWIVILIGTFLPNSIDFTLDVAILFIVSFLCLLSAIFFLIVLFMEPEQKEISYIIIEIAINILILPFVMYHAQTIHGSRYAEMRLNDALLGSLILFHDFLIIYWLTFYWQVVAKPAEVILTSTIVSSTTVSMPNIKITLPTTGSKSTPSSSSTSTTTTLSSTSTPTTTTTTPNTNTESTSTTTTPNLNAG